NRTHLQDYSEALDGAAAILTVHRSNFEQRGFVTSPPPAELAQLADQARIPFVYDVGSGLLADLSAWGLDSEPRVTEAVASGAGLIVFSGDKLLGGPQAGCLVGRQQLIAQCGRNPLARALRSDKLTLAALAATLALYQDHETASQTIPVLAMLTLAPEELARRASLLASLCPAAVRASILPGESAVGGGSFAGATLPTTVVAIDAGPLGADSLALRLRLGTPPVVARVSADRLLFDPRTLPESSFPAVARAIEAALLS
ncbi:MAG: aminotransferase class V-fold PLP-dependent enzyme, partial [Gemmatimonadales bacterium]